MIESRWERVFGENLSIVRQRLRFWSTGLDDMEDVTYHTPINFCWWDFRAFTALQKVHVWDDTYAGEVHPTDGRRLRG